MSPRRFLSVAFLAVGIVSNPARAQFDSAEPAIKYGQGAFHMISIHMQRINGMLRGEAPFDRARLVRSTGLVRDLIALPWNASRRAARAATPRTTSGWMMPSSRNGR